MRKKLIPFTINSAGGTITVDINPCTDWVAFNECGEMQEFIGSRPEWSNPMGGWVEDKQTLCFISTCEVLDLEGANWRDLCFPASQRAIASQTAA